MSRPYAALAACAAAVALVAPSAASADPVGHQVNQGATRSAGVVTPTFTAPVVVAAHDSPPTLAVTDLNHDGLADVVIGGGEPQVGAGEQPAVGVFLANRDGTLKVPVYYPTNADFLYSIDVTDVNGDGIPDVVGAEFQDGQVMVMTGKGDGTFGAPTSLATGPYPGWVTVADVDGDGIPDIVTLDEDPAEHEASPAGAHSQHAPTTAISVLRGTGGGSFAAPVQHPLGHWADQLVVADMNGDGRPDVVTEDLSSYPSVAVELQQKDGSLGPVSEQGVGSTVDALAVADLNSDGIPDVVVSHPPVNQVAQPVSMLLGSSTGLQGMSRLPSTAANPMAVGDLTADGHNDVVIGSSTGLTVLGPGAGGAIVPLATAGTAAMQAVAIGDVNGDGRPDIVTAGADSVSVILQGAPVVSSPAHTVTTAVPRTDPSGLPARG